MMINEHKLDNNGKVVGVHLTVHRLDKALSARAELIDEYHAEGKTICYVSYPQGYGYQPVLYTGYQGNTETFHEMIVPNSNEIPITNAFTPPNLGPLAVGLVDKNGILVSDIVGSLGLPYGHHVSYRIVFEHKVETGIEPPIIQVSEPNAQVIFDKLNEIISLLNRLLERN